MFWRRVLLVVLVCLAATKSAKGEFSCVAFNRSDLVFPCSIYDPSAFAYIDLATTSLEAQLAYMQSWISGLSRIVTEPTCREWAVAWACQEPRVAVPNNIEAMRSCALDNFGELVAPPTYVPACLDMCRQYFALCKPVLDRAGLGALFPDTFCDAYTNDGLTYNGQHIDCYNVTPGLENATSPTCPREFQQQPSGACYPRCPSPEYSADDVFAVGLMQQIVAWISFVAASALLVVFAVMPQLRKYPNRIIAYLLLATLPLSLAFMLATFVGGNVGDVWCGDVEAFPPNEIGGATSGNDDQRAINNTGLCVFQAWLIVWSTLAVGLWWLVLLINTALIIFKASRMDTAAASVKLEIAWHVLCWGLPTVLVIVPTAAGKMDYEATAVFCFIASANGYGWQIGCWFVPMGTVLVLGAATLFIILLQLVLSPSSRAAPGALSIQALLLGRLLLAVVFLLVVVTLIVAYLSYSSANLSDNLFWIFDYLVCRVANNSEQSCRDRLYAETSLRTSYNLGFAATFFLCLTGIFLAIFFATSQSILGIIRDAASTIRSSSSSTSARSSTRTSA